MNIGYLTQADSLPEYPLEWFDIVNRQKKVLTLEYTYSELKEEVNKRTAFLGKYRSTENAAHLLDVVEMTEDESPLFESYIQTIAAEVYDCFSKYSGNNESSFKCSTYDGVKFICLTPENLQLSMATPLDIAVKDALVYGVIYQWLLIAKPDEAENYIAFYSKACDKVRERANALNQPNYSVIIPRPY